MMRRELATGLLMLALTGCGGGGGDDTGEPSNPTGPGTPSNPTTPTTPSTPSNSSSITVSDNQFNPSSTTVTTGTTVTWTWAQGNYEAHSVTFADGAGSSARKTSGTHQRTFGTAGSFPYQCEVHGAAMSGTVVVAAP